MFHGSERLEWPVHHVGKSGRVSEFDELMDEGEWN